MGEDKKMIYGLLDEIRELIAGNENEDGTFRFDALRIRIALEFAKTSLEKSIAAHALAPESEQVD